MSSGIGQIFSTLAIYSDSKLFIFLGLNMLSFKGYGVFTAIYLALSLLVTKIFYPNFRLIRLPFFFRVKGEIMGGDNLTTGVGCRFDVLSTEAKIILGHNIQVNDYVHIACFEKISIGRNTLIASRVYISDHDHDLQANIEEQGSANRHSAGLIVSETFIGDDCWIGEGVAILKGVRLGDRCIVGANAVVTKSFPSGSIIAGVPARLIKTEAPLEG